jgi:sorting nexin-8
MPTPRKPQTRADLVRSLLPSSDVPDSYVETFDTVVAQDGSGGRITSGGVARTLAAAKLGADAQARIMGIIVPGDDSDGNGAVALDRNQFNVLLALIGLAQEGEAVGLDGVDERRRGQYPFRSALPTWWLRVAPALRRLILSQHSSASNSQLLLGVDPICYRS